MIALWMLYATLVALVLGLAALAAERACAALGLARRWTWLGALAAAFVIPAATIVRPDSAPADASTVAATAGADAGLAADARDPIAAPSWLGDALRAARERSAVVERWHVPALVAWGIATSFLLGAFLVAVRRLAARRRDWHVHVIDGEAVLLARDTGPAVVGALRPRIVIPEWALDLPRDERALMLAHEREHLRARDPLTLHMAALGVVLLPWNAGVWWIVRRLRLAVELDCDARVLRATRDAHAYGTLLVTVGSRHAGAPLPLAAPALLERPSSLERRIAAMLPSRSRFPRLSLALAATGALAAVLVACELPSPEMLAPDGKDMAAQRVYGAASAQDDTVLVLGDVSRLREVIVRRHPEVARGVGESVVFLVRDDRGQIVHSERQDAANAKTRSGGASSDDAASTSFRMRADTVQFVEDERFVGATRVPSPPDDGGSRGAVQNELRLRQRAPAVSEERAPLRAKADEMVTVRRAATEVVARRPLRSTVAEVRVDDSALPRKRTSLAGGIPRGIAALAPASIQSIEVSKHAAGRIGPDPIGVILIQLKPGASLPLMREGAR